MKNKKGYMKFIINIFITCALTGLFASSDDEVLRDRVNKEMDKLDKKMSERYSKIQEIRKTALQDDTRKPKYDYKELIKRIELNQTDMINPELEDFLTLGSSYYWQNKFFFGIMDKEKAESFLLSKLNAEDRNTKINCILLLSAWLISKESIQSLQELSLKQTDDLLILQAIMYNLSKLIIDPIELTNFYKRVLKRESKADLKIIISKVLNNLSITYIELKKFKDLKKVDKEIFQREYQILYDSYGKEGDLEILSESSDYKDEESLRKLKQKFLYRMSDESFYDYEDINKIILYNRFLFYLKDLPQYSYEELKLMSGITEKGDS